MAITDLAKQAAEGVPWRTCAVCHHLRVTLPPVQADALRSLLANPNVRYTDLADALREDKDYPLDIKSGTLARHAKGECDARERLRAA